MAIAKENGENRGENGSRPASSISWSKQIGLPMSDKNREPSAEEIQRIAARPGIPADQPPVTPISCFGRLIVDTFSGAS